jgi:hypothetical protein
VTVREPEWNDDQRLLLVALMDYEAQICHGCGGFLPETTHDDAEGSYEADPPWRCHRCTTLNKHKAEYRKEFKDDETGRFDALVVWSAHTRKRGGGA